MSWSWGVAKKISKLPSMICLQKNHAQLQFYKRIPCNWKCWLKILLQCGSKASQARIKWAPEPANHANHPSKVKLHEQADLVKQQARQLTSQPTNQPILKPLLQSCWSLPTNQPSNHPTNQPTDQQTNQITNQPANQPTIKKRVKRNSRYQPCAELNTKNSGRWQLYAKQSKANHAN